MGPPSSPRLVGRSSCLEVEGMAPLEERMEELGGDFLDLVVEVSGPTYLTHPDPT